MNPGPPALDASTRPLGYQGDFSSVMTHVPKVPDSDHHYVLEIYANKLKPKSQATVPEPNVFVL